MVDAPPLVHAMVASGPINQPQPPFSAIQGSALEDLLAATLTNRGDGGVSALGMVGPQVPESRPDRRVVVVLWVLVFSAKPVQGKQGKF